MTRAKPRRLFKVRAGNNCILTQYYINNKRMQKTKNCIAKTEEVHGKTSQREIANHESRTTICLFHRIGRRIIANHESHRAQGHPCAMYTDNSGLQGPSLRKIYVYFLYRDIHTDV